MTEIDPEAVQKLLELELPPDNDAGVPTAGAWLAELLKVAWQAKDDAFKRPFGFSGPWWNELYAAMVRSGLAEGEFEEDSPDHLDYVGDGADALILAAIDAMGQPQESAEADDETPGYWHVRAALAAAVGTLQLVSLGTDDKLAAMAREALAKVDETMQAAPDAPDDRTAGLMPMGLRFDDADPVAVCLVSDCKWHAHGDAMTDATKAWTAHLAEVHRLDWPED